MVQVYKVWCKGIKIVKVKKLVYIAPHLSTGGMPQYLCRQIELLLEEYEIYCIEWENCTGGKLVVQRNKIQSLLGDRLITLTENKENIINILNQIGPDILHLQEVPEYFIPYSIAERIYGVDRDYIIIETSHDSSFDTKTKLHYPDKFLMVSNYQVKQFKDLNIPVKIAEYPIENKIRVKSREQLLKELGLDSNVKHVVNIGLFTPRKNQAEVLKYARQLAGVPVMFHFIGNQADNFADYWKPLMENLPPNCRWWGERDDVDTFYQIADLFLFTSKGNSTDKETMPLVLREAIGWKIPILMYNLEVYENYFNSYSNIGYLDFNSRQVNVEKILKRLNLKLNNKTAMVHSYGIDSSWNLVEQKAYYWCEKTVDFPVIVCLKEYQSDTVMWAIQQESIAAGVQYWMTPISKEMHSYETDPDFSGAKLCIYRQDTDEQVYEKPFYNKFVDKPNVRLSNFVPYSYNYKEYFVEKKYDRWLKGSYTRVIDVGANVGVFSEYMLRNRYADYVTAIECDPLALKDLKKNFELNSRVTIEPKALSTTRYPIKFYHSDINPVISSTIAPEKLENHAAGVKGDKITMVNTVTLEDLLLEYITIDLLKIDIEGAEYDILLNAETYCFDNIKSLFIECHFFEKECNEKYYALLARLKELGYTVEEFIENLPETKQGASECIFAKKL